MLIDNCFNKAVLPTVFSDDITVIETIGKLIESNNDLEKRVTELEKKVNSSSDNK